MLSQMRVLGSSIALTTLAACAQQAANTVPRPVSPQEGPHATISTVFTGGMLNRRVETRFSVDKWAYVLVGHLGADGTIDVLYPKTPRDVGPVKGAVRLNAQPFNTAIDPMGSSYGFARRYRTTTAKYDSYDGTGDGFVFIIASQRPMNYQAITNGGAWDTWDVDDYYTTWDPRLGVRDFADELVPGAEYSISYAKAYSSIRFANFMTSTECALLGYSGAADLINGFGWYNAYSPMYVLMGQAFFSPLLTGGYNMLDRSCANRYALYQRPRWIVTTSFTPQLGPLPKTPDPRATPKTTRAWTPRKPTNPRTMTYRHGDDGWGSRTHTTSSWGGGSSGAGSSTRGATPMTNTAVNSGANSSATTAPAAAPDRTGNAPRTKQ